LTPEVPVSVSGVDTWREIPFASQTPNSGKVTGLLHAWMSGNQDAFNQAVELVYPELKKIAHRHLSKERPGHLLQTTALVNESYIRLARLRRMSWNDRAHFSGIPVFITGDAVF
jgi:hypothetical protein